MKKKNIVLASFLAAIMALSGCASGGGDSSSASSAAGGSQSASAAAPDSSNGSAVSVGKLPLVSDKAELSVFAVSTEGDMNGNWSVKYYEDQSNVHINWKQVPGDQFKEKMNLLVASGEKVDIIMTPNLGVGKLDFPEVANLANQGLIVSVDDLVDQYSVFYKKTLEDYPELKSALTLPDGKMYAVGTFSQAYHVRYYQKLWFNKTWCDNLGLALPATTDEFYDTMVAFRDKDPNGNGQADEIPYSTINRTANHTCIDGFLMTPFEFCDPQSQRLYIDNGKVIASFQQPGYQEGLKYLANMYAEGLISKQAFTQDQKAQIALNEGTDATIIGCAPGPHAGYIGDTGNSDRWQQYIALPPLKDKNGVAKTPNHSYNLMEQQTYITRHCERPDLAMAWLDWFFDEETGFTLMYGPKGQTWDWAAGGELGTDGKPAKFKQLTLPEDDPLRKNAGFGGVSTCNITTYFHSNRVAPQDKFAPNGEGYEKFLFEQTQAYEAVAVPLSQMIPKLYYSKDEVSELSNLQVAITGYVEECIARFVTGDMDTEKDWDKFQSELNRLGMERYLELVQGAYDQWAANNQ